MQSDCNFFLNSNLELPDSRKVYAYILYIAYIGLTNICLNGNKLQIFKAP